MNDIAVQPVSDIRSCVVIALATLATMTGTARAKGLLNACHCGQYFGQYFGQYCGEESMTSVEQNFDIAVTSNHCDKQFCMPMVWGRDGLLAISGAAEANAGAVRDFFASSGKDASTGWSISVDA